MGPKDVCVLLTSSHVVRVHKLSNKNTFYTIIGGKTLKTGGCDDVKHVTLASVT